MAEGECNHFLFLPCRCSSFYLPTCPCLRHYASSPSHLLFCFSCTRHHPFSSQYPLFSFFFSLCPFIPFAFFPPPLHFAMRRVCLFVCLFFSASGSSTFLCRAFAFFSFRTCFKFFCSFWSAHSTLTRSFFFRIHPFLF